MVQSYILVPKHLLVSLTCLWKKFTEMGPEIQVDQSPPTMKEIYFANKTAQTHLAAICFICHP